MCTRMGACLVRRRDGEEGRKERWTEMSRDNIISNIISGRCIERAELEWFLRWILHPPHQRETGASVAFFIVS